LVVAQSSSEIPEGLMNNPVYFLLHILQTRCSIQGVPTEPPGAKCRVGDFEIYLFFHVATAPIGPGLPRCCGFTISLRHTTHSVGLFWTGDQPNAETST
jgi:hypothetical protein